MRLKMFLAIALALGACAGSYMEVVARCRCDRPARGERKAARQERRSARRGYSSYQYTPATPSVSPYDSGVQPLGASEQPRFRLECTGRSCRLVPVTPQAKAADCPPAAPATTTPEPEPSKEPTGVIEPSAFENVQEAVQAESDPPPPRPVDPKTAWRPDSPVIPPGAQSGIPQLDE